MKRRILSSLMALVLVFGLLPATAFAEEDAAPAAAKTIYVDAMKGDDTQTDVGTTAAKAYQSIGEAVKAAESGDTIQLGEGNYSLYDVCGKKGTDNTEYTKNKDLTFIGAGPEKLGGASVLPYLTRQTSARNLTATTVSTFAVRMRRKL